MWPIRYTRKIKVSAQSKESVSRMHNSWAKHNLTFKFHVFSPQFLPSLSPIWSALCRALIISYLVITDDTFFLVADIGICRGLYILIWLPIYHRSMPRIVQNYPWQCKRDEAKCFSHIFLWIFVVHVIRKFFNIDK